MPIESPVDSRVLEQALLLSGEEQARFVRDTYKDDPAAASSMLGFLSRICKLGSFLGEPALAPSRPANQLKAGELLEKRFQILALAGVGGMGEVYRVHDELSGDILALKVCRDMGELSGHELDFLRSEILVARRISHPNVCRIHELFATERLGRAMVFFTMEWLEGEPLTQTISASAPIPAETVLAIAAQVGAALDAIHQVGIVHRDLKPGNIFLVEQAGGSRRAVITDFGLARPASAAGGHEASETAIRGTPDYMAPEQLLGEAVGPAADIYALALIIYEMLTGKKLYGDANLLQTIIRRVTEARPELALSESLPGSLIAPLTCALNKRPLDRHRSAAAFLAALHGIGQPKLSRRTILSAIPAAAMISVSSWWAFSRFHYLEKFGGAHPALMITPMTFSTGQNDLPGFARTTETLLRIQLNESAYVSVLSQDDMQKAWDRMSTPAQPKKLPAFLDPRMARQLALRSGSPYVLYGDVGQTAEDRVLRLRLELLGSSVNSAEQSRSREFVLHEDRDILDTVHDAAGWVRLNIGESPSDLANHFTRPEELTTHSWAALKEYTAGDSEWKSGHAAAAILHLKTALEIDSEFAAASTRFADILMANGQPDDAYEQYAAAARWLAARNLTDRESLRGRGLFALDVGLNQEAAEVFARYILEYPNDPLPKIYRSTALERLERTEEAEGLLSEAIRISAEPSVPLMLRSRHYLEIGRLEDAQRDLDQAHASSRRDWADQTAMAIAFARHDLDTANRCISRMRTSGSAEFKSKSFSLNACLLAEQRQWAETESILHEGLEFDKRAGVPAAAISTKQRMRCQVYLSQGKRELAKQSALESLEQAPGYEAKFRIACVLAQLGEARATESLRQMVLPKWPIYEYWQLRLASETALARGDVSGALKILPSIPQPPSRHIFPEHALRIARAAGQRKLEQSLLQLLFTQRGRWWYEPEKNSPGLFQGLTKAV